MAFGNVNTPGAGLVLLKKLLSGLTERVGNVELTIIALDKVAKGAVPATRKVNNKELNKDIELTAADVGARPSTWTPTAAEVGARPSTWTPTAAQVGAKESSWLPFQAGTTAPSDKTKLWIDTTANTGGLKYHNGTAWVPVPVLYT